MQVCRLINSGYLAARMTIPLHGTASTCQRRDQRSTHVQLSAELNARVHEHVPIPTTDKSRATSTKPVFLKLNSCVEKLPGILTCREAQGSLLKSLT